MGNVACTGSMAREQVNIGMLADLAGYHLRRASAVFLIDFTASMNGTGLRQVPFAVLSVVAANPGINQGSVARILGIKRPNMVALINELIDKGLIRRRADRSDRRAFSLSLTESGNSALVHALERIEAHEARLLAEFSPNERQTLIDLLSRIEKRAIEEETDEPPGAGG